MKIPILTIIDVGAPMISERVAELYSPIEVYISEALRTVSTLKLKGAVPIGRAWKLRNIDLDCLGCCWDTINSCPDY